MSFNLERQPEKRSFLDQRCISIDCSNGLSHSEKAYKHLQSCVNSYMAWHRNQNILYTFHGYRTPSTGATFEEFPSRAKRIADTIRPLLRWQINRKTFSSSPVFLKHWLTDCRPLYFLYMVIRRGTLHLLPVITFQFNHQQNTDGSIKKAQLGFFFHYLASPVAEKLHISSTHSLKFPRGKKQQQQNPTSIQTVHISDDA